MHLLRALARSSVLLSLLLAGAPARADLSDDAARLARIWSARGAQVARLDPIFVEHGRARAVAVSPAPALANSGGAKANGGAKPGSGEGCTTVVLLAPRTAEFLVDIDSGPPGGDPLAKMLEEQMLPRLHPPTGGGDPEDRRLRSASGTTAIVRCGASRSERLA